MKKQPHPPEKEPVDNRTSAQISHDKIMSMPLDEEYHPVPDLPIPLMNSVLIKKVKPRVEGVVIIAPGANTQEQSIGIIMAAGPLCPPEIRVGLRCYFDCRMDEPFRHNGVTYLKMDFYSIYYIIPDPSTVNVVKVKDDRQVHREKSLAKNIAVNHAIYKDEQNELDRKKDKSKGKIRTVN